MIVYLSYSIANGLPENMEAIKSLARGLRKEGIIVLDPSRHGFPEARPELTDAVVARALQDVNDCDLVLAFYDHPSVGQSCEMFHAQMRMTPILLVTKTREEDWSYWLRYCSSAHTSAILCAKDTVLTLQRCKGGWHQMCEILRDKTWFHVIEQ